MQAYPEEQTTIEGMSHALSVRPNDRFLYQSAKRLLDLVISVISLVLLSPILLVAMIAIKIEDPGGKVIYRQLRVGKGGVPFSIYKLRSMYSNADEIKLRLMDQNEMDGPVFKIRNDPRITKTGRFLRKYSIDEIPQVLNVILGSLSLVGPRPLPVSEARACTPYQRQRELVKPGITCIWQVSGRNDVSFERWIEMDLEYIENQSIRTDLKILFKTIPAVLLSRGAS